MKALLLAVCLSAACLMAGAGIPYDFIKSLRSDGLPSYTPERHLRHMILMLSWGGAGLLIAGTSLVRLSRVQAGWTAFVHDMMNLFADIGRLIRAEWRALAVIGLVAASVRVLYLHQPMRYDEAYSYIQYAAGPFYTGISRYWDPNNHLLNTLLVHCSTELFGPVPWACRLPAMTAGVLLAPLCFHFVLRHGRAAGWLAGIAVAANPVLIEYSTSGRGYMIQTSLVVLLFALTRSLTEASRCAVWSLWSVTAALALWTIPTSLYAVAATVLWLLWNGRISIRGNPGRPVPVRQVTAGLMCAGGLTLLLYTPVFACSGFGAVTNNSYVMPLDWGEFFSQGRSALIEDAAFLFRDQPLPTIGFWIVSAAAALLLSTRRSAVRLATMSLVFGLLLAVLQRVHPPARVWQFLIPLGILLGAIGFETLLSRLMNSRWRTGVASLAVVVMAVSPLAHSMRHNSILLSNEGGVFRDAPGVVRSLLDHQLPGEPVLAICPASSPLVFYWIRAKGDEHDFPNTWGNASPTGSVLIVVNHSHQETLQRLFDEFQFSADWRRGEQHELAAFDTGRLIRVTCRNCNGAQRDSGAVSE